MHRSWSGEWAGAALIAERWLAVPSEGSLHVLDLDATGGDAIDLTTSSPRGLVARFDEIACATARDDLLLVGDRSGTLRRIEPAAGFRETSSWRAPDDFRTETSPCATWLQLSASGRFACATLAKGLHLVELASSRAHAIPRTSPAGHASFAQLPSGDEVLFASLPSYMGVSMFAIYDRLQELAAQGEDAAVIRRVDPKDGRVVGLHVAPCSTGSDDRLHVLDEHRVLAVGARIDLIDDATGASGASASRTRPTTPSPGPGRWSRATSGRWSSCAACAGPEILVRLEHDAAYDALGRVAARVRGVW